MIVIQSDDCETLKFYYVFFLYFSFETWINWNFILKDPHLKTVNISKISDE